MSKGENLVIHTNSSYGPALSAEVRSGNYDLYVYYFSAYNHLRSAELSFYHQFFPDVDTIDEFLNRIRELFKNAEGVEEYLKRFTNANLSKLLPKKLPYFEQGYQIEIDGDLEKIIFDYDGPSCHMEGDLYLAINPENVQLIKHILNTVLNRSGNNKFQDSNKITSNLVKTLNTEGKKMFNITASTSPLREEHKNFDITAVSKPEYNKENIMKLMKDTSPEGKRKLSELRMQMRKSLNEMKQFLFNGLPGDSDLRNAVEETWNSVIPKGEDVLLKNFFFEGQNYAKALLGQGGEFYNKVIISYIGKKVGNPVGAQIIGSILKGGAQPRTDLQIMTSLGANIGFQTKNVNGKRNIAVNTNASLIQDNFGDGVTSTLVNYFANTDYASSYGSILESIKKLLEDRFFQAMNLNIKPELDDMQTNTFYFIGGSHIIPGSEIINEIMNSDTSERPQFEITGSRVNPSLSNQEYKDNFTKYFYWKYPKGENSNPSTMVPTGENTGAFSKAAASISISTSFSISAMIDSGKFRIFY